MLPLVVEEFEGRTDVVFGLLVYSVKLLFGCTLGPITQAVAIGGRQFTLSANARPGVARLDSACVCLLLQQLQFFSKSLPPLLTGRSADAVLPGQRCRRCGCRLAYLPSPWAEAPELAFFDS